MYELVNPFEEVVVFGKAVPYDVMYGSAPKVVSITRRPGTRGTGLSLTCVTNKGGKGGPATRLQHYTKSEFGKGKHSGSVLGSLGRDIAGIHGGSGGKHSGGIAMSAKRTGRVLAQGAKTNAPVIAGGAGGALLGGGGGYAVARRRKESASKALNPRAMFGGPASQQMAGALTRRGPKRGLQMIADMPKRKSVPGMSLGSAGSKGSRIAS